jgi:hypothetical protein
MWNFAQSTCAFLVVVRLPKSSVELSIEASTSLPKGLARSLEPSSAFLGGISEIEAANN